MSGVCKCGWKLHSPIAIDISCKICGSTIHSNGKPFNRDSAKNKDVTKLNAWQIIHSRIAACIEAGEWHAKSQKAWHDQEFIKLIPCGSCGGKWASIANEIDWTTAESAFCSVWKAHNEVSQNHVNPPLPAVTYEHCRALYLQQPSMDDCCVAVTSLSPNRFDRQTICLDTWKRAGLSIFAVQSASEVCAMRDKYPQVSTWCVDSEPGPPAINRLADVAVTIQKPVLLINSDIEIHGEQRLIREAMSAGILHGVRQNYSGNWWHSKPEEWGIDVFGINPEFAASLPQIDLRIGKPMWDYWIPYHAKTNSFATAWITEPLFFHQSHKVNWTPEDWNRGANLFCDHYNLDVKLDWKMYRKSMAEPLNERRGLNLLTSGDQK